MRTVKEFKDAGVEFAYGDKCKDSIFHYSRYWVLDNTQAFCSCQLTEFAWRDLATKPDNAKFKIELDIANHLWRPSLNQGEEWPDEQRIDVIGQNGNDGLHYDNATQQFEALASDKPVKPVFTQAMANAGELPPVGSKCMYSLGDSVNWFECEILMHVGSQGVVMACDVFEGIQFTSLQGKYAVSFKPLDNRTQEEKAIDEMLLLAIDSNDDIAKSIIYEACFKLYKAGYRKHADA